MLGIQLTDADALSVPLVLTDHYGNFVPGGNGPRSSSPPAVWSLPTAGPVPANVIKSGHAFLLDIAHNANPFHDPARSWPRTPTPP